MSDDIEIAIAMARPRPGRGAVARDQGLDIVNVTQVDVTENRRVEEINCKTCSRRPRRRTRAEAAPVALPPPKRQRARGVRIEEERERERERESESSQRASPRSHFLGRRGGSRGSEEGQ